jgi:hypothetical protein
MRDRALVVMENEMSEYTLKHIKKINYLTEWIIDAMVNFHKSEVEKLPIHNVVSSSDLIVVEVHDEEIKIITRQELEQWQKSAIEFDGFEGWIVRGQLVK